MLEAASPPIDAQPVRSLSLAPGAHPRGLAHWSAASGLVRAFGRIYVIGDDEHHLAISRSSPADGGGDHPLTLHRLIAGDLPADAKVRKRAKPDFEVLLSWPRQRRLIAMGSGSAPGRDRAVMAGLDAQGKPEPTAEPANLTPLYDQARQRLSGLNIEGAAVLGGELVLLNRGHPAGAAQAPNALLRCAWRDFSAWLLGRRRSAPLLRIQPIELGRLDGVALGFTDAAAHPNGDLWFTAAAEDSRDSVADGAVAGSVLGVIDAGGTLDGGSAPCRPRWMRRLGGVGKVEGIALSARRHATVVWMVDDADDPVRPAWLYRALVPT